MKDIKDYVGLYLNCDVFFDRRIWKMFKISESIIHLKREGESVVMVYPHDTKPILRRLESLTEAEMVDIFKKISLFDLSECQFEHGIGNKEGRWVNAIMEGVVMDAMEYDGRLFYTMNNDGTFDPINSQWEVAAILLKYGFDLFNLIDSGLTLDKALLNPLK